MSKLQKKTSIKTYIKTKLFRSMISRKRLTPAQRMASRIGYMGAGFIIAGQWTLEPLLFITGFLCVIVQVSYRKQWNLVALNFNGLIAWIKHLINSL